MSILIFTKPLASDAHSVKGIFQNVTRDLGKGKEKRDIDETTNRFRIKIKLFVVLSF